MRLEGAAARLRAQLRKARRCLSVSQGHDQNVRYTTFARQTGATPSGDVASASELPAAIAAAQERDECLPGFLSNDSLMFAKTRSC